MTTFNSAQSHCLFSVNRLQAVLVAVAALIWSSCSLASDGIADDTVDGIVRQLDELTAGIEQAAVLLVNNDGVPMYAINKRQPMVPASTVKLLTGLMALEHWGENFQAETEFYFDPANSSLHVSGSGDPFLVSEEIAEIAAQLRSRLTSLMQNQTTGLNINRGSIKTLSVDHSRFSPQVGLPWQGTTSNPFDAVAAALAANFNTVNLAVEDGRPVSAEEQTPLTRLAWLKAGQHLDSGNDRATREGALPVFTGVDVSIGRINTGQDVDEAARYFGELLAAFLWQQGAGFIDSAGVIHSVADKPADSASTLALLAERIKVTPEKSGELIYTHQNSRPLKSMVSAMLEYSTNFIANNLALMLAADSANAAGSFAEFRKFAHSYVWQRFGWKDMVLEEGAGLSSANRLNAEQLVQLVGAYRRWPGVLPAYKKSDFGDTVFAKTGSLTGISTLAGTIAGKNGNAYSFAILLRGSKVQDSRARDKFLTLLKKAVDAEQSNH